MPAPGPTPPLTGPYANKIGSIAWTVVMVALAAVAVSGIGLADGDAGRLADRIGHARRPGRPRPGGVCWAR